MFPLITLIEPGPSAFVPYLTLTILTTFASGAMVVAAPAMTASLGLEGEDAPHQRRGEALRRRLPDDVPPDHKEVGARKLGDRLDLGCHQPAAGAPVIASPVGVLETLVAGGETGRAAGQPEDWEGALDRLLGDRELRLRCGIAAREAVQARWSYAAHEPAFLDALWERRGSCR